jgi:hypothetical protein
MFLSKVNSRAPLKISSFHFFPFASQLGTMGLMTRAAIARDQKASKVVTASRRGGGGGGGGGSGSGGTRKRKRGDGDDDDAGAYYDSDDGDYIDEKDDNNGGGGGGVGRGGSIDVGGVTSRGYSFLFSSRHAQVLMRHLTLLNHAGFFSCLRLT